MSSDHFNCIITMAPAVNAVTCPEGHLFSRSAILRWITTAGTCPISRQPLAAHQLRPAPFVDAYWDEVNAPPRPTAAAADTATVNASAPVSNQQLLIDMEVSDDDDESEDDEVRFANLLLYRASGHAFSTGTFYEYDPPAPAHTMVQASRPTGRQLVVLTADNHFNPNSGLWFRHTNDILHGSAAAQPAVVGAVERANRSYLRLFNLEGVLAQFTKYRYTTISDDPTRVAGWIASSGMYVYDLFRVGRGEFIVYSFSIRRNGAPVTLPVAHCNNHGSS